MDEVVKAPVVSVTTKLLKKEYIYKKIPIVIKEHNGKSSFQYNDFLVPENWSETSSNILVHKYSRKAGVPYQTFQVIEDGIFPQFYRSELNDNPEVPVEEQISAETSAHQIFHRLAGCWTYWGIKTGYFKTEESAVDFYNKTYDALYHQIAAPNSPQWFNTGLHWAYGISGDGSRAPLFHYDHDTQEVVKTLTTYEHPQVHACFIQSIADTLISENGIMDLFLREATVFKYGSGSGTNYSNLRGEKEKLSGGGKSSGLMSFLKVGDASAGAIKSGGTTRRAARMVVVDVDHPDIEEFVAWKTGEENKAAALVTGSLLNARLVNDIVKAVDDGALNLALAAAYQAGVPSGMIQRAAQAQINGYELPIEEYSADWQGQAYASVSGQNANNSVSVTHAFMEAVRNDLSWDLIARKDRSVMKTIQAKKLWDDINYAAWASADPGLHYVDTMNEWNTVINDERIVATNPCSEYVFLNDTACNLASLNIVAIWEAAGKNTKDFIKILIEQSKLWYTVLDISIQMAQFTSKTLAEKTFLYRTTGLGYANIGSFVMRQGLAYGTKDANDLISGITSLMTASAYEYSAYLADELGAFPRFDANREPFMKVMHKHANANYMVYGESENTFATDLLSRADSVWQNVVSQNQFRNAQVTVIAPTGTIGLVMDCDTTGIEPDFSLVKHKSLAGGGYMKLINQAVPEALEKLGYNEEVAKAVVGYVSGYGEFPKSNSLDIITQDDIKNFGVDYTGSLSHHHTLESIINEFEKNYSVDLSVLKFKDEKYYNTERHIFGYGNIDDCDLIRDEHKVVFACAVSAKDGGVVISPEEHLLAMAAAQPFVSGAISKTINMPGDATIEDIAAINMRAWLLGLKCVSVYRDGSKLSQPLMSSMVEKITKVINQSQEEQVTPKTVAESVVSIISTNGVRRKLPNKRGGYTQKVKIGGHGIYLRTGEYADGTLGEIFIDMHKEGAAFRAMMNNFAIAVSLGLQYGVPLNEFVEAFHRVKFEPAGLVSGHDNIKSTTSLMDFIFRDLAFNYMGREDLVNVKPEPKSIVATFESLEATVEVVREDTGISVTHMARKMHGYTGDTCDSCGSARMVTSGTCATCQECGETSGCS